ncbi:MAG: DUF4423 domain-containing protein [Proteobacteria bacterium]|nr:DUF4423 domain-containing protein [Pseudomonadota bacterium]
MEIQTEKSSTVSQADWEQWLGNWIWRATQCLVEAPDFNPSPKWIANRLNITIEKAVEAIEGLERLGCIKRKGISFEVVNDWMQLTPDELSRERLLAAQSRIAPQLISKLDQNDAFTSQFFLGNKEMLAKYTPKFMELFRQMNEEAQRSGHTDVLAAQISFVQLTAAQQGGQ